MKLRIAASGENEYGEWKQFERVMTNADRIRSMTDKELAVWLAGAMLYVEPLKAMRIADWEKWLKQESKEWNLT